MTLAKPNKDMLLTPTELADEICMLKKPCLVVEGQIDKLFWDSFQNRYIEKRMIFLANRLESQGNKDYVITVMQLLQKRAVSYAYGVVDIDYDYVNECIITDLYNLLYYNFHDLEIMLIKSSSFKQINSIVSSVEKMKNSDELLVSLFKCTYPLGILRLISINLNLNLDFKKIDFKKMISHKNKDWVVSESEIIEYLFSHFGFNKEKRQLVFSEYSKLITRRYPLEFVCNGHDIIEVLSLMTNRIISNDNPIKYSENIITEMLILAYTNNLEPKESSADLSQCNGIFTGF